MTCQHCTPAKRCDSCERVAIVRRWLGIDNPWEKCGALLAELDAHDRARLAAPETVERVARAIRIEHGAEALSKISWEELLDAHKEGWRDSARAAIAAIAEAK